MDFRLGFGKAFGEEAEIVAIDVAEPEREHPRRVAAELYGDLTTVAVGAGRRRPGHDARGSSGCATIETEKRAGELAQLQDPRAPLHPMRVYGELAQLLDRDAIVIGDGGDFVSFAGRVVDSYNPGCWLDPGPFGCLGSGPGYALAAKLAHPDRQVVLLLGDGAFGFSGMEYDTLARHGVNVVGVMGNNGIWALEKHPMEFLYNGWSVAADLRPETPLRRRGRGARRPRRAGPRAGRAAPRAGARVRVRQARAGERADGPDASPTRAAPTCADGPVNKEAARGGGGRLQSGPVRTGRGTCLEGPIEWSRRREAPMMRHRPDLCVGGRRREARPPFRRVGFSSLSDRAEQSNRCPSADNLDRFIERRREVESARPQRMSRSDASTRSRPKDASTSSRIAIPATITGARAGSRPASRRAAPRAASAARRV